MDIIVSHRSALLFWRHFSGRIANMKRSTRLSAMTEAVRISGELLSELEQLGLAPSESSRLDLLYADPKHRSRSPLVNSHVMSQNLQRGSFVRVSPHVLVVCPELCFAELAEEEPIVRLVHRGCELCATYYLDPEDGRPHEREGRTSLTTAEALAKYLALCAPRMVPKAARTALPYVLDGSASPRETTLALLLSLPPRLGGFGLPAPELNHKVELGADAYRLYPHNSCRCDLFWKEANFALEYQGEEAHWDRYTADVARAAALAATGFDVIALTKEQLADAQVFATVADTVAGKLGRKLRIRREDFVVRHTALREAYGL